MKDGIIKGTGNSRFLKSVENFKTLYPTYDAFVSALVAGTLPVDFNGINAAGWEQIGDALGKYALLKDATAEALGLGDAALPDNALRVLSRLHSGLGNEYLWAKISSKEQIVYGESLLSYSIGTGIGDSNTYIYSESVELADGAISFINPTSFTPSNISTTTQVAELAATLTGKYIKITGSDGTVRLQCYCESATAASYSVALSYRTVEAGASNELVGYVNSPDPNAYPPAEDDGFTYMPLGMLGNKVQIATGKYNGTGTSGSSNPKSLTFDFAPRIIILTHDYFDADVIDIGGWRDLINRGFAYGTSGKNTQIIINADTLTTSYQSGLGFAVEGSNTPSAKKSADGKTITWYGSNAASQANETKHTYYYVAIG